MMHFPPFKLDTSNQCLWRRTDLEGEDRLMLTPKAYGVLRVLVENSGRLVTQSELLEAVWPDVVVQPEALKSQILDLRRILGDDARNPRFIETLHRRGYRFIAQISDTTIEASEVSAHLRLIARDHAQLELRDCLRRTVAAQRQMVFVTGEPGIGKTTLVDAFQRETEKAIPDIWIARGQCIEGYGGTEPFYPVLEALSQLLRQSARVELSRLLESQAPTWFVQFPNLLTRQHRETLQREILGATRERMLREINLVFDLLSARRPLLFIFEDLQWVDHSTIDLLSALARQRTPSKLMLLSTYRADIPSDHLLKAVTQELVPHRLCHEIALQPFTQSEVADYLAADSAQSTLPEGLAQIVHRHSDGNPLFIVASLEHLTRRGLLSRDNGIWQIRVPLEEIDLGVPETLRQMIEAQIRRLSAEEQRALEAASVIGAAFDAGAGAAAASMKIEAFEDVCESLARKQHVLCAARRDATQECYQYQFVHALYREVFYTRQPPSRLAKIHLRCGDWLESRDASNLNDVAPVLAHHFEKAGSWERAVKYLIISADIATNRLAHREAASILRHALTVVTSLPPAQSRATEVDILRSLCAILEVELDDRAVASYDLLADKTAEYGFVELHVRALNDMAGVVSRFDNSRCIQILNRAIELAPQISDPGLRTRELATSRINRIVLQGWTQNHEAECRAWIEQARPHITSRELAPLLLQFSWILVHLSRYREACAIVDEALANFDVNFIGQRNSLGFLAKQVALEFLGEWGRALQWSEGIAAAMARNGNLGRAASYLLARPRIYIHAEDCALARPILETMHPLITETKLVPLIRYCEAWIALANVRLGNLDQAMELLVTLDKDLERLVLPADITFRPILEWGFVETFLAAGDTAKADLHHRRWVTAANRIGEVTWQGLAWEAGVRIALANGDVVEARQRLSSATAAIDGYEAPLASWKIHASAADMEELLGNHEAARHYRILSGTIIRLLAESLPETEPARAGFLTSTRVRHVLQTP